MNDTNQLPVLTHHELPGTRPTQSTQSAIALSDVIGSFDFFSLPLFAAHLSSIYRALSHQHSWS